MSGKHAIRGKHIVIVPSSIVAEVCAVISRLTNSEEEGIEAAKEIQQYCIVVYDSETIFDEILPIIAQIKGSGIDSMLAAISFKEDTMLITNVPLDISITTFLRIRFWSVLITIASTLFIQ